MLELPEVETVGRGLESILLQAKFGKVVVRNRRLVGRFRPILRRDSPD